MAWWSSEPRLDELLEMDYGRFVRMKSARNIYNAVSRLREAKGAAIHSLTDNERRLLRSIMDSGVQLLD